MKNNFFSSSVGKKILMAVTGLILTGFVLGHMAGNLQIFAGKDKINHYAAALKSLGPLLWAVRIFLLAAIAIHVKLAIQLKAENSSARPVNYFSQKTLTASVPSRIMIYSGITLASFIIYHLLHYTFGIAHPEFMLTNDSGHADVYFMVVKSFQQPVISGVYLISMLLLSMHLWHGFSSTFQSLGITNAKNRQIFELTGLAISFIVFLGNISIPAAVLLGYISL